MREENFRACPEDSRQDQSQSSNTAGYSRRATASGGNGESGGSGGSGGSSGGGSETPSTDESDDSSERTEASRRKSKNTNKSRSHDKHCCDTKRRKSNKDKRHRREAGGTSSEPSDSDRSDSLSDDSRIRDEPRRKNRARAIERNLNDNRYNRTGHKASYLSDNIDRPMDNSAVAYENDIHYKYRLLI